MKLAIRLSAFFVLLGRAYQHLFWDGPYRTLFWDEELFAPLIEFFGGDWGKYVTSPFTDDGINIFTSFIGLILLFGSLVALFSKSSNKFSRISMYTCSGVLFFISFLYFKNKYYQIGQFLEYALQFMAPIIFIKSFDEKFMKEKIFFYMRVAIAFTFIGHALYAIGFHPVPGHFVDMVINILSINETDAFVLLKVVGAIDLSVALVLLTNINKEISRYSLIFCIFWGAGTSMARIFGNFDSSLILDSLHQWTFEFVYRLPHTLIPLALFLFLLKKRDELTS